MTESEFRQEMLNDPRDAFFPTVEESPPELFVSALSSGNYMQTDLSCLRQQMDVPAAKEQDSDFRRVRQYQAQQKRLPRKISRTLPGLLSTPDSRRDISPSPDIYIQRVWVYTATGVLCDTFVHSVAGPYWEPQWEGESFFCSRIPKFPGFKGRVPYQFQEEFVLEKVPPSVVWWWERMSGLEMEPMREYLLNKDLTFSQLADLLTVGAPWA